MKNLEWPLVANEQISQYLKKSILTEKLGGSIIFSGPDNLGKTGVAKFFAMTILCASPRNTATDALPCGTCASCRKFLNSEEETGQQGLVEMHGDFHVVKKEKDKKNISIEQVRDFIRILGMSSFSLDGYKIGIIKHAESLSTEAANALLKTLEEPKKKTLIILIAQDFDSLPATISSRSQILNFKPLSADHIYDYLVKNHGLERKRARDISRLCLGRPALALKLHENTDFFENYKSRVEAFFEMMGDDFNTRMNVIDGVLDKSQKGQVAVREAHRILEIWQGVARDCLLFNLGHNNLVQHIFVQDRIKQFGFQRELDQLTNLIKEIRSGHIYLKANVSPRLVLERIAVAI